MSSRLLQLLERHRRPNSVFRVRATPRKTLESIRRYAHTHHMEVQERVRSGGCELIATNPQGFWRLLFSGAPQVQAFELTESNGAKGTLVRFRTAWKPKFAAVALPLLALTVAGWARFPFQPDLADAGGFLVGAGVFGLLIVLLVKTNGLYGFREGLYEHLCSYHGTRIELIEERRPVPSLEWVALKWLFLLGFGVNVLPIFFRSIPDPDVQAFQFAVWPMLGLMLLMLPLPVDPSERLPPNPSALVGILPTFYVFAMVGHDRQMASSPDLMIVGTPDVLFAGFMATILLLLPLFQTVELPAAIRMLRNRQHTTVRTPERLTTPSPRSIPFWVTRVFWLAAAPLNLLALWLSVSGVVFATTCWTSEVTSTVLPSLMASCSRSSRMVLMIYAVMPLVAVLLANGYRRRGVLQRQCDGAIDSALEGDLSKLCDAAGIPAPKIRALRSSSLAASAQWSPFTGSTITLTDVLIQVLARRQVAAVMAHEVIHLQHHSPAYGWWSWFAGVVMIGRSALRSDEKSHFFEFDADRKAVDLLKVTSLGTKQDFVEALVTVVVRSGDRPVEGLSLSAGLLDERVSRALEGNRGPTLKERFALLLAVYAGDLSFYVHPTLEERIAALEDL